MLQSWGIEHLMDWNLPTQNLVFCEGVMGAKVELIAESQPEAEHLSTGCGKITTLWESLSQLHGGEGVTKVLQNTQGEIAFNSFGETN